MVSGRQPDSDPCLSFFPQCATLHRSVVHCWVPPNSVNSYCTQMLFSRTGWAPPLARIYPQASAVSWCDRQTAWDSKKTFLTTWPVTNQQTHTQTNTRKSRNICYNPWHSAFRNVSMAMSLPQIQNRQGSRPHNRQHIHMTWAGNCGTLPC